MTCGDHSTTVTTRYFTQATHKSYGPMTQLLPGPQCPNVTHVPTVLPQTSSLLFAPLSFTPSPPSFPPSFHAQPLCPFQHPPPTSASLFIIFLTLAFLSVCLSVCLFVSLIILLHLTFSPSPPFLVLCPCGPYAGMGDPSWSRRGSCPLHVA